MCPTRFLRWLELCEHVVDITVGGFLGAGRAGGVFGHAGVLGPGFKEPAHSCGKDPSGLLLDAQSDYEIPVKLSRLKLSGQPVSTQGSCSVSGKP